MRWVAVQRRGCMLSNTSNAVIHTTYVSRCASFSRGFELGAAIRDGRVGTDIALPTPPSLFSFLVGFSMFSLGSLMVIVAAVLELKLLLICCRYIMDGRHALPKG